MEDTSRFPHRRFRLLFYLPHAVAELADACLVVHVGPLLLGAVLETLLKDTACKGLHHTGDIPSLITFYLFGHIRQHPLLDVLAILHVVYHLVHCPRYGVGRIELHLQIGREAQFVGQTAHHALKETVYRLHPEIAVVVQDARKCRLCLTAHVPEVGRHPTLLQQSSRGLQIMVALGQSLADGIQLLEDAVLHLRRGLVGEGHGQGVPEGVSLRSGQQQGDIFDGQGERLARASRSLVYSEYRIHSKLRIYVQNYEINLEEREKK